MRIDPKLGVPTKKPPLFTEPPIYNCHIHLFTKVNVPSNFLVIENGWLGPIVGFCLRRRGVARALLNFVSWLRKVPPAINPFVQLREWGLIPDIDLPMRYARMLVTGDLTIRQIFHRIQNQYPEPTVFVVLPMDMTFMNAGALKEPIEVQHKMLLELAHSPEYQGHIIPFYAADPRQPDIVERVRENTGRDKFRGVKIYPNLGYYPADATLMRVYEICSKANVPVMTHCASGGVWRFDLKASQRKEISHPHNYVKILEEFPTLRFCLAHYGGVEEWERHLIQGSHDSGARPWVSVISEMIRSGKYPNLYTDISMTLFYPRAAGMYFDYFDYLNVLLADPHIREHVLYGSDYYMAEIADLSEKQVSLGLRSRLGEELYFQIAHYNPRRYLGLARAGDWKKPRGQ